MQLEKTNRQMTELQRQQVQAEAERAGLIERAMQATALADSLQKQVDHAQLNDNVKHRLTS